MGIVYRRVHLWITKRKLIHAIKKKVDGSALLRVLEPYEVHLCPVALLPLIKVFLESAHSHRGHAENNLAAFFVPEMSFDAKALLDAVEKIHNAEAVTLLSELVRLDSTLGNESAVQVHMAKLLTGLGMEVETFPVELDKIKCVDQESSSHRDTLLYLWISFFFSSLEICEASLLWIGHTRRR